MANAKQSQQWRPRRLIPDDIEPSDALINFTVPAPWSHADLVRRLGKEMGLIVDPLPPQLEDTKSSRASAFFGSAAEELDQIATHYENLYWSSSDGVLQFSFRTDILLDVPSLLDALISQKRQELTQEKAPRSRRLSPGQLERTRFVEIVGSLWCKAPRGANGRLSEACRESIANELDRQGFQLGVNLEGAFGKALANWNQRNPRKAIHNWRTALKASPSRRGVLKTLSRAGEIYKKTTKLSPQTEP